MIILALLGLMYARVIMHTCRLVQGMALRISSGVVRPALGDWVENNVDRLLAIQRMQTSGASRDLAKFFISSVRPTNPVKQLLAEASRSQIGF
jgi:hypothetical protein